MKRHMRQKSSSSRPGVAHDGLALGGGPPGAPSTGRDTGMTAAWLSRLQQLSPDMGTAHTVMTACMVGVGRPLERQAKFWQSDERSTAGGKRRETRISVARRWLGAPRHFRKAHNEDGHSYCFSLHFSAQTDPAPNLVSLHETTQLTRQSQFRREAALIKATNPCVSPRDDQLCTAPVPQCWVAAGRIALSSLVLICGTLSGHQCSQYGHLRRT
jgi:hypothetical protein